MNLDHVIDTSASCGSTATNTVMIKFNNDFLTAASGDTNIAYQCHRTFPTHNINGCCDIGADDVYKTYDGLSSQIQNAQTFGPGTGTVGDPYIIN
jgi:hypothetical protein